jgi:glycerophosphoryl diester phosphodiesterase
VRSKPPLGLPEFAILGHRGAPHAAPENTLESFLAAIQSGADGVELDVHLTKDRAPVVCHDPVLEGSGGAPITVAEISWEDLASREVLVEGGHAARLVRLEKVLSELPKDALVDIELKDLPLGNPSLADSPIGEVVARYLEQHAFTDRCFVTSFYLPHLQKAKRSLPTLATGWLLAPGMRAIDALPMAAAHGIALLVTHDTGLPSDYDELARQIEQIESEGFFTLVWTVNDPGRALDLKRAGASGVITDVPGLLAEALRGA